MPRLLVAVSIVLALLIVSPVSADIDGSARQHRANVYCAKIGIGYERHGLTDRERYRLVVVRQCKREPNGSWDSARIFTQ